MNRKLHFINIVLSSNIAQADKLELIELIKKSKNDDDAIVRSLLSYFNVGKTILSAFFDSPEDFIDSVKEFLETLSNY